MDRPPRSPDSETNALTLYLREVRQFQVLNREQETELGRRIRRGDAEAREQMILSNLRLVVKIARDYQGLGLPLLDLIAEGNVGLMRAAERFDPERGAKFSTYASLWIKLNIRRALCNSSRIVRLPVHVQQRASRARQARVNLHTALGREPSEEEVARAAGLPQTALNGSPEIHQSFIPLDAPVDVDESETVASTIADDKRGSPQDDLLQLEQQEMLDTLLHRLTPREREIIQNRYGLNGRSKQTLETLSGQLSLTREGIRQIEVKVLKKLRLWFQKRESLSLVA